MTEFYNNGLIFEIILIYYDLIVNKFIYVRILLDEYLSIWHILCVLRIYF